MSSGEACLVVDIDGAARRLDVATVREVVRAPAVARVPASPPGVRGLAALRGRLIPVVDLADSPSPPDRRLTGYLVVIAVEERLVGLVVDRIGGVIDASTAAELPAVDLGRLAERA
ncbi:MAG TPA: chemotaxis protein CheW [Kofleriaceae bacterium]|nr:chemotaxis protein CheW [Kofleriaceae bacterium]